MTFIINMIIVSVGAYLYLIGESSGEHSLKFQGAALSIFGYGCMCPQIFKFLTNYIDGGEK